MLKPSRVLGLSAAAAVGAALIVPAVAAPAWFGAKSLSASGQSAAKAQVAVDPAGNVVAVWERSNGTHTIAQAARYHAASNTWSATADLSAVGQSAVDAHVAVDGSGNAVAVWERFNGSYNVVQAARFTAATGTWGPVADLSTSGQHGDNPRVALDGAGNAIAVWSRGGIIQGAHFDVGAGSWGAATDLSVPGQPAADPQIAFDPSGDALGVWERSDGSHTIIRWAKFSAATGTWGGSSALSASGQNADRVRLAADSSGNAVAVWERFNGAHTVVRGARYIGAAGAWGATEDLSAAGQNAARPHVAVDSSGNAIAVWDRGNGAHTVVQASRLDAATNLWSAPADLSAPGQNATAPVVGFDSSGNAAALWTRSDGANTRIQSARRPAGGAWGGASDLSSAGGDAARPAVAVAADGNAVGVWERSDGVTTTIQRAFLDGVAPTISSFRVPAKGAVGQSLAMSVAAEDRFGLGGTRWDFGDGTVRDESVPTTSVAHSYGAPGAYTVTVTQRDASGEPATRTARVVVDGAGGLGPASRGSAPTPAQTRNLRCGGRAPTIVGTSRRDVINGTPRADVIIAFAGNDVVRGRGGNDRICLGKGNDRGIGGRGADRIFGQNGNDRADGSAGNDRLFGGRGRDVLLGRAGRDILSGGVGNDRVLAGRGNDRALGGSGNDRLFGGRGRDILHGGAGRRDLANGGGGKDRCLASEIRRSC